MVYKPKKKSKLNLPKGYLSYSQYISWNQNPAEYRRHYYEGVKSPETKEMRFGHKIAKDLEEGTLDPKTLGLPRYAVSEHRIIVPVQEVPILAFLDTYEPLTYSFRELKTGRNAWDSVRVARHVQLPFYMLAIREKYGEYDKVTFLDWLQTRLTEGTVDFGGVQMTSPDAGEVELTGKLISFKRSIPAWELDRMAGLIREVAEEISVDFTKWQKENL